MQEGDKSTQFKLFYSYSHKDEAFGEKLEGHLAILRRNNYLTEWHDRRISAGNEWEEEINYHLEEADIILLLISSNFLASDYCYDTETIRALEKHQANESVVIPVILSPCLWRESKLGKLQALPTDGDPISTAAHEDQAWLAVAEGVLEKVRELQGRPRKASVTFHAVESGETDLDDLVLRFLKQYDKWFFSPLRIQKWRSRQHGFDTLAGYKTKDIRNCLARLEKNSQVRTTKSQKGNTIYKAAR